LPITETELTIVYKASVSILRGSEAVGMKLSDPRGNKGRQRDLGGTVTVFLIG
jgi:hypothetical protein